MGMQVADTEPTGALSALLTTGDGVSLVFDPLIRKPTQVAAEMVDNIAQGGSGGRRLALLPLQMRRDQGCCWELLANVLAQCVECLMPRAGQQ